MFFIVKYSIVAVVFYMIMSGLFTVDFSGDNVSLGFNYRTVGEKIVEDVSSILSLLKNL